MTHPLSSPTRRHCHSRVRRRGCHGQQASQSRQGARYTVLVQFQQHPHISPSVLMRAWIQIQEVPVIVTEQNPRGTPRLCSTRVLLWPLRHCHVSPGRYRALIDSPWQDRRPLRLGLSRAPPPRHDRKDALLDGDPGGSVPPRQAQLQVSRPFWYRGAITRERNPHPHPRSPDRLCVVACLRTAVHPGPARARL